MEYSPLFSLFDNIIFVLLEVLLTAAFIGFTPASSSLRWISLPLVGWCVWHVLTGGQYDPSYIYCTVVTVSCAPICFFRYIDLVLVQKSEFGSRSPKGEEGKEADGLPPDGTRLDASRKTETLGQWPPTAGQEDFWKRVCFGMDVALSPRKLNTPRQNRNLYPRSPSLLLSAVTFAFRMLRLALCLWMAALWNCRSGPAKGSDIVSGLAGDNSMQTMAVWGNSSWVTSFTILGIFSILHGVFGSIAVTSGIIKIEDLPESTSDNSTIRKFWGADWLQIYSRTSRGLARFLFDDLFEIPRNTLVGRYSKIFAAFLISGLVHMLADIATGVKWHESGSISFACLQAVAICLEDGVQAMYCRYKTYLPTQSDKWTTLIGHIWVGLFFLYATPVWANPALRKGQGSEEHMAIFGTSNVMSAAYSSA